MRWELAAVLSLWLASSVSASSSTATPPSDWAPRIAAGNMLWSPLDRSQIAPGLFPMIGNGNVGMIVGPILPYQNKWPWRDAGFVKLAGVFNGLNFKTPSHRAEIPPVTDIIITRDVGGFYVAQGMALDMERALVLNRTLVNTLRCPGFVVESRLYAHRAFKSLLVLDLTATPSPFSPKSVGQNCTITVEWPGRFDPSSPDLKFISVSHWNAYDSASPLTWKASTLLAEEPGLPLRSIGVAFSSWASSVNSPSGDLLFTPDAPTLTLVGSYHSDLDASGADPVGLAAQDVESAEALGSAKLLQAHQDAWSLLWADGGIELAGNASFAATVNASLYDILSSMRSDVPYSTSPGGLGGGGYNGHSFWDLETWMSPVLSVLHPDIAFSTIQYRLNRVGAAQQRAVQNGFNGSFWPWESAFTGLDTSPWRAADLNEHHISSDIPLAWRFYSRVSADPSFLKSIWPALSSTCSFWECRLTRTDSEGSHYLPGWGRKCSAKDGRGNFTALNVIPPDEGAGIVDDSVYTNAAAAETLKFCIEVGAELGVATPPIWAAMAASPYLPLTDELARSGPVHDEYAGYEDDPRIINQADVALLQYPLMLEFPTDLALRDLDYWSSKTKDGMFTGDASYANAYLALGISKSAIESLGLAFNHIAPPFNVFTEIPFANGGATQHFITGSGGYLQNFLFGFPGLRVTSSGTLSFSYQQPTLPPLGVTSVTLRGINLGSLVLGVSYNQSSACVALQSPAPAALLLNRSGQPSVKVTAGAPYCFSLSAFSLSLP